MRVSAFLACSLALASAVTPVSRPELAQKFARVLNSVPPLRWSADGHMATANIATSFLTSEVASCVSSILTPDTAEQVSTWADTVKDDAGWEWSKPLHYIQTPDWACKFEASYCPDNICVYGAILNYTSQLYTSGPEQYYALKFIIHFVGDIHQPLHCGFGSDADGNDEHGTFLSQDMSLHEIWDNGIIQQRLNDFNSDIDSYAAYLTKQLQGPWASEAKLWTSCTEPLNKTCVGSWASDSAALGCKYGYTDSTGAHITDDFDLGMDYYNFAVPIVDEQLAKGGIRLAYLLNNVFSDTSISCASSNSGSSSGSGAGME